MLLNKIYAIKNVAHSNIKLICILKIDAKKSTGANFQTHCGLCTCYHHTEFKIVIVANVCKSSVIT